MCGVGAVAVTATARLTSLYIIVISAMIHRLYVPHDTTDKGVHISFTFPGKKKEKTGKC